MKKTISIKQVIKQHKQLMFKLKGNERTNH